MFGSLVTAAIIATAGPVTAEPIHEFNRLTQESCFQIASGKFDFISAPDIEAKTAMIESFGLEFGIAGKTYNRMKPHEAGALNGTTMGTLDIGEDAMILALGGKAPGCTVIWLSKSGESREYEIVDEMVEAGWKELRPGVAVQRGPFGKRTLVRRDEEGKPYMMNILTVMQPGSEMRHASVTLPIPPHVKLPEGF